MIFEISLRWRTIPEEDTPTADQTDAALPPGTINQFITSCGGNN